MGCRAELHCGCGHVVVLKTLLKPVETPQVQFLDKVDMPIVCMTGAGVQPAVFLRAHRCESSRAWEVALTPACVDKTHA